MKILLVYNSSESLYRLRSELISELITKGHQVYFLAPKDQYTNNVIALGCEFKNWFIRSQSCNPIFDFISLFSLMRQLLLLQPDMVFAFTIKPLLFSSILGTIFSRIRFISMVTGMGSIFIDRGLTRKIIRAFVEKIYRISINSYETVFFQNNESMQYFINRIGLLNEKAILINGSGVNLDRFFSSGKIPVPRSFLMVARLITQKGVKEFVEAASLIKKDYPDAVFNIVGPVDHSPDAIEPSYIKYLSNSGIVFYHGFVSNVIPFLEEAEVFVLPSYYPEGVPRSTLEALAMAKPIITTDWPGCRDTVIEGNNGFLVKPKDVPALTYAMRKFILDPNLSKQMGKNSRLLAVRKFSVDSVNKCILNRLVK